MSAAFKDVGQEAEQISVQALSIFGLLNCQGKVDDKIEHLYNLLQDGGLERH